MNLIDYNYNMLIQGYSKIVMLSLRLIYKE